MRWKVKNRHPYVSAVQLLGSLIVASSMTAHARIENLATTAESTNYQDTGRYEEVEKLCAAFESSFPEKVKCQTFGITPQGRPMLFLVASNDGTLTAEQIKVRKRPVILAQGGIHAGEIDGKDAGFRFLRDLLQGTILKEALSKFTFVFVPVFNVDGHERFGPNNRPNQNGPREMGFRTTAQNYNLNRDYVKADAAEMKAMLALLNQFDPLVYADLHVTDGAQFQHAIAIIVEPTLTNDEGLQQIGRALQTSVVADLTQKGHKALDFYPSLIKTDEPTSGFAVDALPPRFSSSYWGYRNRFGVLVETHSWKPYAERVQATYDTLVAIGTIATTQGAQWLAECEKADKRASHLSGTTHPLTHKNGPHIKTIDFLGYAYSQTKSSISGATKIAYDPSTPQIWRVPLLDTLLPETTTVLPKAGYIVPVEHAKLVSTRLNLHGIQFAQIGKSYSNIPVSQFRATKVDWPKRSNEGRMMISLTGAWENTSRDVAKGSLFIPLDQPRARLLIALIEPLAPDSFASWGDFNNVFEQKEYMDGYVAEVVGEKMLQESPKLAKEFADKVNSDPKFKSDPKARLDFFYQRHPSFDAQLNIYPIYRTETAL